MNLEDIVLSEASQSQKDKYCMIPLMQGTWSSQIQKDRKQNGGGFQGLWRGKDEKWLLNGYRVSVLQDEKSSGDRWQ